MRRDVREKAMAAIYVDLKLVCHTCVPPVSQYVGSGEAGAARVDLLRREATQCRRQLRRTRRSRDSHARATTEKVPKHSLPYKNKAPHWKLYTYSTHRIVRLSRQITS